MLISLLLQASAHTQTIIRETIPPTFYIPLVITLIASLIAAWAAITNTSAITKTQSDVAELTNRTARELKEKEYKNDFYKRLIERRLKAWEKSEEFIQVLSYTNMYKGKVIQAFFVDGQSFDSLLEKIRSMVMQSFWLGKEYSATMKSFYDELLAIRNQCIEPNKLLPNGIPAVNDNLLRSAGVTNLDMCGIYFGKLIRISSEQLRRLHDIEEFFNQLLDGKS